MEPEIRRTSDAVLLLAAFGALVAAGRGLAARPPPAPGHLLTLRRLLVLACAALCLIAPATARADGDPASDFLLFGPYYVPLQPPPAKSVRDELNALLRGAATQKKPLRVAVIRSKEDLGAFPQLFGKPKDYARLLSNEIAFAYKGPLLIVMPGGFGTRHISAAREKLLAGIKIDSSSPDAMTRTTIDASRALLSAAGVGREQDRAAAGRGGERRDVRVGLGGDRRRRAGARCSRPPAGWWCVQRRRAAT